MQPFTWEDVRFDARGLVPAIVQDAHTGQVLMLAYMNREALERTLATGEAHFWSRSRQQLWRKGETSGNVQRVLEVRLDCDGDAVLLLVEPQGPACHTGATSCFFRGRSVTAAPSPSSVPADPASSDFLRYLYRVLQQRKLQPPQGSYTARLLARGQTEILKKVGEEAVEVLLAAQYQGQQRIVEETADLLYHLLVLLVARDVPWDAVLDELRARNRPR